MQIKNSVFLVTGGASGLGAAFTLKKFHDALLAQGSVPLPIVRKALLEER